MGYQYENERAWVFTTAGTQQFLRIRQRAGRMLAEADAFRLNRAIEGESGSSWEMLACVDRLVEIGEIREVTPPDVPGQYRVFVAKAGIPA